MKSSYTKKSQVWYVDYAVSITLFIVGLYLIINLIPQSYDDHLVYDSNIISDIIMTEGMPSDWTSSNCTSPGLLSDNHLNRTKVQYLSSMDYTRQKSYFPVSSDFKIYFTYSNGSLVNLSYIGMSNMGIFDNLVHKKRITIYEGKLIIINILVGERSDGED